jgi:hypothetical protein
VHRGRDRLPGPLLLRLRLFLANQKGVWGGFPAIRGLQQGTKFAKPEGNTSKGMS